MAHHSGPSFGFYHKTIASWLHCWFQDLQFLNIRVSHVLVSTVAALSSLLFFIFTTQSLCFVVQPFYACIIKCVVVCFTSL